MNKLKPVKSAASITSPKGSLLAEINNLRKELKDIKQSKKQTTVLSQKPLNDFSSSLNKKSSKQKCVISMSSTGKDKFFKSPKEDFTSPSKMKSSNLIFDTEKSFQIEKRQKIARKLCSKIVIQKEKQCIGICLNEIYLKQKDRKLKMDIQLNKLRKIILKKGPEQISEQINYIISLLNVSTRQYALRLQFLQKNQKNDSSEQNLLLKRQEEQIQMMSKQISQNKETLKTVKNQLKNKSEIDQSLQQLNDRTVNQKNQMRTHNQLLESIVNQMTEKNFQLVEQNRILESKLLKKQEQLIMLDEDVNYLRLQTENYKNQKKELNQLYENTLNQMRQYKRAKSMEREKIEEEKLKWEKQCKLRRNQSEQITALEDQKIVIMKELSELRHLCSIKSLQLDEKKALMHENQKKVIVLQSQVYRLKSQIQTIRNKKQFSEFQNQKLKQQIDDIRKYLRKNPSQQRFLTKSKSQIKNQTSLTVNKNQKLQQRQAQNEQISYLQGQYCTNTQKKQHFNKTLKQKQDKLKALEDIHCLIKKHKKQMHI